MAENFVPNEKKENENNLTEVQKAAQEYINSMPNTQGHVYAEGFTDDKGDTFYTVQGEDGNESAFSIATILGKLNGIEEYSTIANIRFKNTDSLLNKGDILRLKGSNYEDKNNKTVWELQIQKD